MPGNSGLELLSKVKEIHPEIVCMMLSGDTNPGAVMAAIDRGAIHKFLAKPWNDDELRLHVEDAFRMHQSRARE